MSENPDFIPISEEPITPEQQEVLDKLDDIRRGRFVTETVHLPEDD